MVHVIIINSFPLATPAIDLWSTIAIVVISIDGRGLGTSIPIWEVRLLVGQHGRLDLGFRLAVPFGTIAELAGNDRDRRGVSFIRRIHMFGWILMERVWLLLTRNLGKRGDPWLSLLRILWRDVV